MAYIRKTQDQYIIMTNYGYGWEEESTADTYKEAKEQAEEYKKTSCKPSIKIIKKRVKI